MTRSLLPLFCLACAVTGSPVAAQRVAIEHDAGDPQHAYAARRLAAALQAQGYNVVPADAGAIDRHVRLTIATSALGPEGFAIAPTDDGVTVGGGDDRGLIYGALQVVETLDTGTRLEALPELDGRPNQQFRAIKYNLPWETYRPSSALDQHYDTARDLEYWEAFLDMMVENRFNAITLWNMHPYTFMIRPRGFPEASPWTPEEMAEWQRLYRGILGMAKERGLDTYIVHWNIFVSRAFAEAHDVASENYYPYYYVDGDTSEVVRRYMRESVTQVLQEYPDLDGIGVSHGEGMGGMTPLQRQQWVDEVLVAGMLDAGRPVKLIHRVPFSSGTSSAPGASRDVEQVTREAMERLGNRFDGPIWVEIKFNWSHGHSTPQLVKVHGGELGDTYFEPLPTNYRITWQIRNEDFFALRWGVPDFIREHVARNGTPEYVGGYFVGSESYIPALDYFTALDAPVDWRWAFERQWLFYKLWGRLLYDPATPDSVFQAEFIRRYGDRGRDLLRAYALSSATQLRLASLYDSRWDFTLYSEGFLALQGDTTKYISVDRLTEQPTMDPSYVSVAEYVRTVAEGGTYPDERVTPPRLAAMLERDSRAALALVEGIDDRDDASLRYEVADVQVWAHLGLHLAEKLRGAVALQNYRLTGGEEHRSAAVAHLEAALAEWDEVIRITRPLYREMPLTHYNHNFFHANPDNLFHWALIRDEVARDVEIARGG